MAKIDIIEACSAVLSKAMAEIKKKANASHKHTVSEISDFPTSLANGISTLVTRGGGSGVKELDLTIASTHGTGLYLIEVYAYSAPMRDLYLIDIRSQWPTSDAYQSNKLINANFSTLTVSNDNNGKMYYKFAQTMDSSGMWYNLHKLNFITG